MSKHRILVVDDDPDIGMMIKMMLEYHGYSVQVTQRAEQTESLLAADHYDLLIMDMLLSGMNGMDICAHLKRNTAFTQLPVIMISAHPNAKEMSGEAGADDFLSKPFDMNEMLLKIGRLVNAG
jgi:DNA-binding response OmpR family regulator